MSGRAARIAAPSVMVSPVRHGTDWGELSVWLLVSLVRHVLGDVSRVLVVCIWRGGLVSVSVPACCQTLAPEIAVDGFIGSILCN
jgi:hypothetical protein